MQTKSRGNAYLKKGNECLYSFEDAEFDSTDASIKLIYTSKQTCKADTSKHFRLVIEGSCADSESKLTYAGKYDGNI